MPLSPQDQARKQELEKLISDVKARIRVKTADIASDGKQIDALVRKSKLELVHLGPLEESKKLVARKSKELEALSNLLKQHTDELNVINNKK